MSGFLDRLASRAVGEAPLVHPRVRSRFEPDAAVLPGRLVEPAQGFAEMEEVAAAPRMEVRGPAMVERTFEPEGRSLPAERATAQPAAARPSLPDSHPHSHPPGEKAPPPSPWERPAASREEVFEESEKSEGRLRRDPHPLAPSPTRTHTRPGEGEERRSDPLSRRAVAPPLPGDGSADGRGGRGVRVHDAGQAEEPLHVHATERTAPPLKPAEPAEPQPLRLRPRSALAGDLPTVEPDRYAPLPVAVEESEPSETVVQVHIGRIDVRASQPPAPERRPARPSGPRLSLEDYLKRREERR